MLFGTVLGMGALFPQQFTGGIMVGNGIAGVLAGGLRIITKASMPDGILLLFFFFLLLLVILIISIPLQGSHGSIVLYFGLSAGIMATCIAGYFALLRLPITKYYLLMQVSQLTFPLSPPRQSMNTPPLSYTTT